MRHHCSSQITCSSTRPTQLFIELDPYCPLSIFTEPSAFVVRPVDTVVIKGIITILHCTLNYSLSTSISWSRITLASQKLLNSRSIKSADRMSERLIVNDCQVVDGFTDDYSVEYNVPRGQCDLMFNYVTVYLAGIYRCIGPSNGAVATAKFTVLCE